MSESQIPAAQAEPAAEPQPGSREEMRRNRMQSNWVNMVIALAACMALVLVALMIAPQPQGDPTRTVDAAAEASAAAGQAGFDPAAPALPQGWSSNEAGLEQMGEPELKTWYASYVGPSQQWIALRQAQPGADAAAWATSIVGEDAAQTGTSKVAGPQGRTVVFDRYEKPDQKQALVGTVGDTTVILMGTAQWDSFEDLAARTLRAAA